MNKRVMAVFLSIVMAFSTCSIQGMAAGQSESLNAFAITVGTTEDNSVKEITDIEETTEEEQTSAPETQEAGETESSTETEDNTTETTTEEETETETEQVIVKPDKSTTDTYLVDTQAPYEGDYLLAINTSTYINGAAETTGSLPVASTVSAQNYSSENIFGTPDDNIMGYDEVGNGLIDPNSFLPELIVDEGKLEEYRNENYAVTPEHTYSVGTIRNYYLDLGATDSEGYSVYTKTGGVCVSVGEYCMVWVPVSDPILVSDSSKMKGYMSQLAAEFDAQFPKMTEMFGSKETADLEGDNDGKTALLCYDIDGNGTGYGAYTAGYFFGADLNVPFSNATGNNCDCLHIDSYQGMGRNEATGTLSNVTGSKGTIVHELQHMINFSICRDKEDYFYEVTTPTYLNEAYSEAATHLCYRNDKEDL